MNFNKITYSSYEKKWQEGMKNWEGQIPERMISDDCEEAFWSDYVEKKRTKLSQSLYAKTIIKEIKEFIAPHDHVAEIGPGTGNYTFPLASIAQKVTAIDSSLSIIHYLEKIRNAHDINNVEFIHEKWENLNFQQPFDVVFGMNCFYRMYEIKKALDQINKYASKMAVIGMTTGPIQPHYLKLEQEYGYQIKYPRRDYIDLINILYEMGIYASCKVIPLQKVYKYESYVELIHASTKKMLTPTYNIKDIEASLSSFVRNENNKYVYKHDFHAAIISWTPIK